MSQDTDALCVVWHDSPGGVSQQPAARLAGAAVAVVQDSTSGGGAQLKSFDAIKQRLISAAQRPRGQGQLQQRAGAGQPAAAGHKPATGGQADALLEGLFSHEQQRWAGKRCQTVPSISPSLSSCMCYRFSTPVRVTLTLSFESVAAASVAFTCSSSHTHTEL